MGESEAGNETWTIDPPWLSKTRYPGVGRWCSVERKPKARV
ncbi:hypothetical protein RBSH_01932 [Rhodopirellula baltica SH28]|uniref:Uncharacterized protein n=1 Tax=Rhodopirellula baltica SH28 TaxID=993517 RepID=K5D7R6_RHOBT|nr:hypothetical protein [Rhodopirellula baltica]EKK02772.1 hypothetical protein RBSH_01932 [Rhodopirellula baltica SH28]